MYELRTRDGVFYVNMQIGTVESFQRTGMNTNASAASLSLDQAELVARGFAEKKYADFDRMSMKLVESKELDHGDAGKEHSFVWREEINGVLTPNTCRRQYRPGERRRRLLHRNPARCPMPA